MSPMYEYLCPKCTNNEYDRVFTILVPLKELDDEIKCPECGAILQRMISVSSFVIN